MTFRDFLEVFDVQGSVASQAPVQRQGNNYVSTFTASDGGAYTVEFRPYYFSVSEVEGLYDPDIAALFDMPVATPPADTYARGVEIWFRGPSGVGPTNRGIAFEVYSMMLVAIQGLLAAAQPEGLHFGGSAPGMDNIYKRFVKRFLSDAPGKDPRLVYVPLRNGLDYIRKDVYERLAGPTRAAIS
jgi:hypothetical protein